MTDTAEISIAMVVLEESALRRIIREEVAAAVQKEKTITVSLRGDYHPTSQVEDMITELLRMQKDGHQIVLHRPDKPATQPESDPK